MSYLFTIPQKLTSYRFLNTIGNSRSNISAHYDISNEMFAGRLLIDIANQTPTFSTGFLSEDMTYSCAIFEDLDGDLISGTDFGRFSGGHGLTRLNSSTTNVPNILSDDTLFHAQMRKLHHIIRKAKIMPGHRVLEIGSGWGSMAILITQTIPDTTVDTLTLSVEQQNLARQRVKAAGLQDRINVHLMDYRDMPEDWKGAFDRMVSIEMIENVGQEFMTTYWAKIDWALKKKNAVGVVQVITIPEARECDSATISQSKSDLFDIGFERYIREIDFIRKWASFLFVFTLIH